MMEHKNDAALDAFADLEAADMAFDNALTGDADQLPGAKARLIACDHAFAHAIPATAAGMRTKAKHITAQLAMIEDGDNLTENGAASLKAHVESLLAGALAFRIAS